MSNTSLSILLLRKYIPPRECLHLQHHSRPIDQHKHEDLRFDIGHFHLVIVDEAGRTVYHR